MGKQQNNPKGQHRHTGSGNADNGKIPPVFMEDITFRGNGNDT